MKNDWTRLLLIGGFVAVVAIVAFVVGAVVSDALTVDAQFALPEVGTLYPLPAVAPANDRSEPTAMVATAKAPVLEPMLAGGTRVQPVALDGSDTATADETTTAGRSSSIASNSTTTPPVTTQDTTQPPPSNPTTTQSSTTTQPPAPNPTGTQPTGTQPTGTTQPPPSNPTTTQSSTTTQPPAPNPTTPTTTPGAGSPAGGGTGTIVRFFDLCADSPTAACPAGIAATILFSGGAAPPPPLQFEITPGLTRDLIPSLRCDPGWPSSTRIPVVITSNRPFSLLHVTLLTEDGVELDAVDNTRSPPSEHAWYDQRVKASQPTGTTVQNGAHTCVTLETNKRKATGTVDRTGRFKISVLGYAGNSALAKTITFTGQYAAQKPPVRILPLDANRAYVIVPQLPGDTTIVWVFDESQSGTAIVGGPIGCQGNPPNLDTRSTRRSPIATPKAFSQTDMNASDYPWDRSYSHYTLWDLDLRVGTSYTMCARWVDEGTTQEWNLKTPGGIELTVSSGNLRHTRTRAAGTLLVRMYGVPGCFVADPQPYQSRTSPFPNVALHGNGTYTGTYLARMCGSEGRRLGSDITLEALFPDGTNTVYGVLTVPVKTLIAKCTSQGGSPTKAPCTSRLEWRDLNILCGGGLTKPNCPESVWFSLDVFMEITDGRPGKNANPRDWVISKIARLGTSSETVPFP